MIIRCQDMRDVVDVAESVIWLICRDWEVCEFPDIGVVQDGYKDPIKQYKSCRENNTVK